MPTNAEIADALDRVGELLEVHDANPFRVGSYRRAARELRGRQDSIAEQYREHGEEGLTAIPGIGARLASAIGELVETGRLRMLDDLESEIDPITVLSRVPGLGETLARRIWERLGIDSLEELETAAHDGRLATLEGFGPGRIESVRAVLSGILQRRRGPARSTAPRQPSVDLLLDIDEEYRRAAANGELRTIAPRRFNPDEEAWLPIMEVRRDGWDFTALFSNTARAHRLGRTRDWVVIYYERDEVNGQCTVVTEKSGALAGLRVVRGREPECRQRYQSVSLDRAN